MQCNEKRALCLKSCDFIFSSTIRQTLGSVYLISFYKRLYIRIGSSYSWIFCVTSSSLEEVLSELDSDSLKLLSYFQSSLIFSIPLRDGERDFLIWILRIINSSRVKIFQILKTSRTKYYFIINMRVADVHILIPIEFRIEVRVSK